jgi:NADPH2:quinone reductase
MRAVVCHELTGVDGVRYESAWPEPTVGAGQLLVDVRSTALNFPDLLMIHGKYQERPELPFVTGSEMSGVVRAVGADVLGFQVGDRVVGVCGRTLADQVAVDARRVFHAPQVSTSTPPRASASRISRRSTRSSSARSCGPARPCVLGATGGVGSTAIQLGKLMGAKVIAAASSAAKLAVATELGADATIDYSREDLRERLRALTGGKGVTTSSTTLWAASSASRRCAASPGAAATS